MQKASEIIKRTQQQIESANQNLHERFSREFLKEIVKSRPALLEEPNPEDGCTPLLSAVMRNDLDIAILLLSHGANVHAADLNGNTSLHYAIMGRFPQMVKLLLIFRAKPNTRNNAGIEAISLKTSPEVGVLLYHIQEHAQSQTGTLNLEELLDGVELNKKICVDVKQHFAVCFQRSKTAEQKSNSIRMLSLDGGGVRGLVLVQMLMELEDLSLRLFHQNENKTFVQRHFDWIAGSGTGAILALALADGAQLVDCLRIFWRLKDEIFCSKTKPCPSECIDGFLKEQFGENRKMSDLRSGKTRVFVTATKADQIPMELLHYSNYRSPFREYEPKKMLIWKAARMASSSPTYFSSINGIMDGGLIANNPGAILLQELAHPIEEFELIIEDNMPILNPQAPDLGFLISLGAGKTPEVPILVSDVDLSKNSDIQRDMPSTSEMANSQSISEKQNKMEIVQSINKNDSQMANSLNNLKSRLLEQLASSDGQVVETSRLIAHSQNVPYFRFSPLLQNEIKFDNANNNEIIDILWTTKLYMRENFSYADMLALLVMMKEFARARNE